MKRVKLRVNGTAACLCLLAILTLAMTFVSRAVAVSIIAGALTGIMEGALMFPIENLKIQQQLDGATVRHAITRTIQTHGFLGLYRGIVPVLLGAIPSQAIRWGAFEAYCTIADCRDLAQVGIGAMLSGGINSILTGVAIETMKISLIHSHVDLTKAKKNLMPIGSDFDDPVATVRIGVDATTDTGEGIALSIPHATKASHGSHERVSIVALRGWLPTVAKKIVNQSIRFPAHSWALRSLCRHFVNAEATTVSCKHDHNTLNFAAGIFAGLSSVLITQPLDVTKTRMQGLHGARYKNTIHCMRTILSEEGVGAFLHGAALRAFRVSLGAGLTFTLYPIVQSFLHYLWSLL